MQKTGNTPEYRLPQDTEALIFELCGMMSVSGFTGRSVQKLAGSPMLRENFDEIRIDPVGNLVLVRRAGGENRVKILIDTHFDEIGFLVREVCNGGFLRFTTIGGVDPAVLQASDVKIYGDRVYDGVIISTPPHLRSGASDKMPTAEDLLIDTGMDLPAEELRKKIPEGTPVGFAPQYDVLGSNADEDGAVSVFFPEAENTGKNPDGTPGVGDETHIYHRISGKSFDNKACAAAVIAAVSRIPREELAGDVYLLLSNYEETSHIGGATGGAYAIDPDYAMVIDVNLAKVPDAPTWETVGFEAGISLSLSAATHRGLTAMTAELCRENEIPYTAAAVPDSTGTDATGVMLVRCGIPTVDVGLPLKNMHTPCEVISMKDVESLCHLTQAFVCCRKIADTFAGEEGTPWKRIR